MVANGGNLADWIQNLRIVLMSAKMEYVLDHPLGDAPEKDVAPEEVAPYVAHSDDYDLV